MILLLHPKHSLLEQVKEIPETALYMSARAKRLGRPGYSIKMLAETTYLDIFSYLESSQQNIKYRSNSLNNLNMHRD